MAFDYAGTALIITALGAVVGPAVTAYLQLRAAHKADINKQEAMAARDVQNTKIDSMAMSVDGHATEQTRQITALHAEVARLQTPGTTTPTQTAGEGSAPVGIDKGVVTVEPSINDPKSM
jgi:hypothetical protein